jgi:hypothetical protein
LGFFSAGKIQEDFETHLEKHIHMYDCGTPYNFEVAKDTHISSENEGRVTYSGLAIYMNKYQKVKKPCYAIYLLGRTYAYISFWHSG